MRCEAGGANVTPAFQRIWMILATCILDVLLVIHAATRQATRCCWSRLSVRLGDSQNCARDIPPRMGRGTIQKKKVSFEFLRHVNTSQVWYAR